jgi:hypothetical protein
LLTHTDEQNLYFDNFLWQVHLFKS